MVRCRPFAHAASTREADLPVKFHAENTPALPANRKGQSGKVLLCPQQDNLTTSVAHFCIAVLTCDLIQQAAEAELAALLQAHTNETVDDGRASLVRHGHLPDREVMTGIGPVSVKVPPFVERQPAWPMGLNGRRACPSGG